MSDIFLNQANVFYSKTLNLINTPTTLQFLGLANLTSFQVEVLRFNILANNSSFKIKNSISAKISSSVNNIRNISLNYNEKTVLLVCHQHTFDSTSDENIFHLSFIIDCKTDEIFDVDGQYLTIS